MSRCLAIAYTLVVGLAATSALGGCGDDSGRSARDGTTATSGASVPPALARRAPADGEIVVHGEGSPETHGPYAFAGRYLVRFEQYAPEDPALDFSGQTPLTALLAPRAGDPRGARALIEAALRSGRRELDVRGRYFVDVSFGDFPYVIRFTPRD
jgi:hypothetical protein